MCSIIIDVICNLNYTPFIHQEKRLKELVAQLKWVAYNSKMTAHIGEGIDNKEREEKFKLVKYFYLASKGGHQGRQAKALRDKANDILAQYAGQPVAELVTNDPFGELYAERSHHQSDPGSSSAAIPTANRPRIYPQSFDCDSLSEPHAKRSHHQLDSGSSLAAIPTANRPRIYSQSSVSSTNVRQPVEKKTNKNIAMCLGLFFRKVMKGKMPLDELLKHEEHLTEHEWRRVMDKMNEHIPRIPQTVTVEYYEPPPDFHIVNVENDNDLRSAINAIGRVSMVAVDTESNFFTNILELIQIATSGTLCYFIRKMERIIHRK